MILSGMCQVNVLGGGGGSHFSRSLSMSEPVKMISQAQFLPLKPKVDVKAVKENDSSVPVHLWDDRIFLLILFRRC